jgi:hypothetical protein
VLVLRLTPAPELDDRSTLSVSLDGVEASRTTAGALRQQTTWTVPVHATTAHTLFVRIDARLLGGQDRCADVSGGRLWMRMGRDSGLVLTPQRRPATISEFLRFPGGVIGIRTSWSTREAQTAGIAVYAMLSHLLRDLPVRIALLGHEAPNAFGDRPVRVVELVDDASALTPHLTDARAASPSVVRMSGVTTAIAALEAEAAAAARSSATSSAAPATPTSACGPNRLCFETLGVGDRTVSGIGTMRTSTYFTLADIGGWPDGLQVTLDIALDPSSARSGRTLARVLFNGALMDTLTIDGEAGLRHTTSLPGPLLNVTNTLDVDFMHVPAEADCGTASTSAMQARILRTSAFSWTGIGASRHRLAEVIAAGGPVALHLGDDSERLTPTAARILGAIARASARPLTIALARATDAAGWDFFVGRMPLAALPVRLSLDDYAQVVARRSTVPIVSVSPDAPWLALEYVDLARPALSLQATRAAQPAHLESAFVDALEDGRFLGLPGELFVTSGPHTLALDLAGGPLEIRVPSMRGWPAGTQLSVFSISSLIIIGALSIVYRRLGQPPSAPPAPVD